MDRSTYLTGTTGANSDSTLAQQISHDLRSPLAALEIAADSCLELPEAKRTMIRNAINRIRDIANELLDRHRFTKGDSQVEAGTSHSRNGVSPTHEDHPRAPSTQLISNLIDSLVTEKRLQFRSRLGLAIEFNPDPSSYGIFASVQPNEFKRVLSNLINNSAEAITDSGKIELQLGRLEGPESLPLLLLTVSDTGVGMSPETLSQIGARGHSISKPDGNGLGLSHAIQTIESWRGTLKIDSLLNQGTLITICLPFCEPPKWFQSELTLRPGQTLAILDDDTSIHDVWRGRIESLTGNPSIQLVHFSTGDQLHEWMKSASSAAALESFLLLCDFELLGQNENGIEIIDRLRLHHRAILVTSRAEELAIQQSVMSRGIKMIPKTIVNHIPIRVLPPKLRPDAILIDDDTLIHQAWKIAAKQKGLSLQSYLRAEDFFDEAEHYALDTPIYVDSNLGHGIAGEGVAHLIHEMGFTTIYMATGYPKERFTHLSFLKGIRGKEPFFE